MASNSDDDASIGDMMDMFFSDDFLHEESKESLRPSDTSHQSLKPDDDDNVKISAGGRSTNRSAADSKDNRIDDRISSAASASSSYPATATTSSPSKKASTRSVDSLDDRISAKIAAAGRSTRDTKPSSVDTNSSSDAVAGAAVVGVATAGAIGKKASTRSVDSLDDRISSKISAAGGSTRTNSRLSGRDLDNNISNLPNNTSKRMTTMKQQSDLESRINRKLQNAGLSTRSTSTDVKQLMMDRTVSSTSDASILAASSQSSMPPHSGRSIGSNNDHSARVLAKMNTGSSRNFNTERSYRLSRQRISTLSIAREEDFEENVFGEKVSLHRIHEDAPEEVFEDHVMHTGNNSSSTNELPTQYPNIEESQTSLRTNSGYLSTTSLDYGDEQHQRTLATASHYTNFESNQYENKWEKEEDPYFRIKALAFLIFTVGAIAGLFIGLNARNRNSGTNNPVPTTSPDNPREDVLPQMKNFLLSYTNVSAFEDSSSPQYQALNWLVFDDAIALKPNVNDKTNHQILQRYSLMTTYYTFPNSLLKALNWGDASSECAWQKVGCQTQNGNIFNRSSSVETVTSLSLSQLRLKGTFPNETGLLSNLGMSA